MFGEGEEGGVPMCELMREKRKGVSPRLCSCVCARLCVCACVRAHQSWGWGIETRQSVRAQEGDWRLEETGYEVE